jgi:hypothetical protein
MAPRGLGAVGFSIWKPKLAYSVCASDCMVSHRTMNNNGHRINLISFLPFLWGTGLSGDPN